MGQTDLLASQLRGGRLQPAVIRFYCITVLLLAGILLGINFATSDRGRTLLGPPFGGDYGTFYIAGRILNTHGPNSLYDTQVQDRLLHQVLPNLPDNQALPFAHAPFFALIFRPLAMIPYEWSYLAWFLVCIALYLAGFAMLWTSLNWLGGRLWGTALLLLLAFEPLVIESLIGGQATAFGFFCLALAIRWMDRQEGLSCRSGVALSLLLYKPPLLIFLLPMLLFGRQFRVLLGFILGASALVGISCLFLGSSIWASYFQMLQTYSHHSASADTWLRSMKYVDIASFFRLLIPSHSVLSLSLAMAVIMSGFGILLLHWMRVGRYSASHRRLLLAGTIALTIPLNIYAPAYDVTLVAIAVVLMAAELYRGESELPTSFRLLLIFLCIVPWISQPLAKTIHFQPMTLVLIWAGVYALRRIDSSRLIVLPQPIES